MKQNKASFFGKTGLWGFSFLTERVTYVSALFYTVSQAVMSAILHIQIRTYSIRYTIYTANCILCRSDCEEAVMENAITVAEDRNNFTTGSIPKKMLRFMLPIFGSLVLQAMYGAGDLPVYRDQCHSLLCHGRFRTADCRAHAVAGRGG